VAGAVEDQLLLQIRQHTPQVLDLPGANQAGNDAVFRTGNEEVRLVDLRALPWGGQFPIAINVAIPVQPAAEPGLPVDLGEVGEVGLSQLVREWPIRTSAGEEALALLDILMGRRIG
jgi:hypothetical protein